MKKSNGLNSFEKYKNKFIWIWVIFLPVILVLLFGWVGRIISIFMIFIIILWICSYSLLPEPKYGLSDKGNYKVTLWQEFLRIYFCVVPWEKDENRKEWNKKLTILFAIIRPIGLLAAILVLYLALPFVGDVISLIKGGSDLKKIEGKVVLATQGNGALDPIYMSVNLDNVNDEKGNPVDYYFFYAFRYLRINDDYCVTYLNKSKYIVDIEKK